MQLIRNNVCAVRSLGVCDSTEPADAAATAVDRLDE